MRGCLARRRVRAAKPGGCITALVRGLETSQNAPAPLAQCPTGFREVRHLQAAIAQGGAFNTATRRARFPYGIGAIRSRSRRRRLDLMLPFFPYPRR